MGGDFKRESANERLGANVRILRERKDISQAELARLMTERGWPWHQSTVYRVESGKQTVGFGEVVDLAEILRTSLDRFTWASAEANATEFVYAAGARLNQRYEITVDAVLRLIAEGRAAERVVAAHEGSEYERVREACEDVARRTEEYSLQAAIDAGIDRYEGRLEEQARLDREAENDDTQGES